METRKENQGYLKGHILISTAGKIIDVILETGLESNKLKSQYKDVEIIDAENTIVIHKGFDSVVKFDYL